MTKRSVNCWHDRSYEFRPEATALLVIDMQRDFFPDPDDPESDGTVDPRTAIVPRVAALTEHARQLGIKVIHTREGYHADLSDVSGFRRSLEYVGRPGPDGLLLIRGEAGHDFLDALQPRADELVIDKAAFSAFHGTGLDDHLRQAGIDHLILCGVTTQCCVHSTLRSAVDCGYWCLTVADCCAAEEPILHDAALALIAGEGHLFGWICDLADFEHVALDESAQSVTMAAVPETRASDGGKTPPGGASDGSQKA